MVTTALVMMRQGGGWDVGSYSDVGGDGCGDDGGGDVDVCVHASTPRGC